MVAQDPSRYEVDTKDPGSSDFEVTLTKAHVVARQ